MDSSSKETDAKVTYLWFEQIKIKFYNAWYNNVFASSKNAPFFGKKRRWRYLFYVSFRLQCTTLQGPSLDISTCFKPAPK